MSIKSPLEYFSSNETWTFPSVSSHDLTLSRENIQIFLVDFPSCAFGGKRGHLGNGYHFSRGCPPDSIADFSARVRSQISRIRELNQPLKHLIDLDLYLISLPRPVNSHIIKVNPYKNLVLCSRNNSYVLFGLDYCIWFTRRRRSCPYK